MKIKILRHETNKSDALDSIMEILKDPTIKFITIYITEPLSPKLGSKKTRIYYIRGYTKWAKNQFLKDPVNTFI